MMNFRRSGGIVVAGLAAAVVTGLSAGPAVAATRWTVTPGGPVTATAGTTTVTDSRSGASLMCASSDATGSLKSGSGQRGSRIGGITMISFIGCTGPLGLPFTLTASHLPWQVNAGSFNSATGVTTGTISGMHAAFSGPGCSGVVDGTGAAKNNGKVAVTYTNGTGVLQVLSTGGNLHVYQVSGCAGVFSNQDAVALSGSYTVSPQQTITSP